MTKLAQRPGAEAAPVAIKFTDPYRPPVRAFVERVEQAIAAEAFPAWSSLSWGERAEYVARYCR